MAAWHIWMTEEDKCPVSPTCQEFALYLDEQGYRDKYAEYTREFFEAREFEWALQHKDESTANLNQVFRYNAKESGKGCLNFTPCDGKDCGDGHQESQLSNGPILRDIR